MILLIDAGNTLSKVCRLQTRGLSAAQELDEHILSQAHGGQAIISCVASHDKRELLDAQLKAHDIQRQWLSSPAYGLGIRNSYEQPEKLGVDRFLALAAAFHQAQQACVVIDAGTAITVDVCNDQGQHIGGLIAPGLRPLSHALRPNTELPWVEGELASSASFAQNTEDALRLGALKSAVGLIEHACKLATDELPEARLFLTGGSAMQLKQQLEPSFKHDDNLVFQGIELFARRKAW